MLAYRSRSLLYWRRTFLSLALSLVRGGGGGGGEGEGEGGGEGGERRSIL